MTDTNHAIACLKEAQTLMLFVRSQSDATAFIPVTDPSEEHRQLADFQLRFMRNVCEDRLSDLRQMLEESKHYLRLDEERELELKAAEDAKLSKVKELQSAIEEEQRLRNEHEAKRIALEQRNAEEASRQAQLEVEELTKKIHADLINVLGPKKGKKKQEAAAAEDQEDFIDHASYHDAPIEGEEEDAFGENENLSRHSEKEELAGLMSGESAADEDYLANKSDEDDEESGRKKRKHDKDKKSKKIKKEKKEKKHKKDKKKHKKHRKASDQEEEKEEDLVQPDDGGDNAADNADEIVKPSRRLQRMRDLDEGGEKEGEEVGNEEKMLE